MRRNLIGLAVAIEAHLARDNRLEIAQIITPLLADHFIIFVCDLFLAVLLPAIDASRTAFLIVRRYAKRIWFPLFPSATGQLSFTSSFAWLARLTFRQTPRLLTLITKGLLFALTHEI